MKDIVELAETLPELKLIVIDPFAEVLEAQNDRRTDALNAALAELKTLARERRIAIILVNASDKASTGRMRKQGVDVLPFLQARTRALWCVEQDPVVRMRYFWLPLRTNLAYGPLGLKFLVEPWSKKVSWDPEPVELHPDDFKPRNRPPNSVARAGAWIKTYLQEGRRRSREVLRDAALAGISRGALYEAKARLGVASVKETRKKVGRWDWVLPREGALDQALDLLEDPKALARFATGGAGASAARVGEIGVPEPSASEDQKVPEDLAGVVPTPRADASQSLSPDVLRPSTSPTGAEREVAAEDADERPEPSVSEDQKVPEDLPRVAPTPRGAGPLSPAPDGLRPSTSPTAENVEVAADAATSSRDGRAGPRMDPRQRRGRRSAPGRRSEDSKIQSDSAPPKGQHAERMRPAP